MAEIFDLSVPSSLVSPTDTPSTPSPGTTNGVVSQFQLGNAFEITEGATNVPGAFLDSTTSPFLIQDVLSPYGLDLIWPNWPPNLPHLDLLRHL
jgi:hypothetical protein